MKQLTQTCSPSTEIITARLWKMCENNKRWNDLPKHVHLALRWSLLSYGKDRKMMKEHWMSWKNFLSNHFWTSAFAEPKGQVSPLPLPTDLGSRELTAVASLARWLRGAGPWDGLHHHLICNNNSNKEAVTQCAVKPAQSQDSFQIKNYFRQKAQDIFFKTLFNGTKQNNVQSDLHPREVKESFSSELVSTLDFNILSTKHGHLRADSVDSFSCTAIKYDQTRMPTSSQEQEQQWFYHYTFG